MGKTRKILPLEGPMPFSSSPQAHDMPATATIMGNSQLDMEEEETRSVGEKVEQNLDKEEGEEDGDFDDNDTECSFEFSSSMSLDLHPEHKMLSAEELFFNGQLRPLQSKGSSSLEQQPKEFRLGGKVYLPISFDKSDAVMRRNSDVEKEATGYIGSEKVCEGEYFDFRRTNLPMVRTSLQHESLAMAKQHLKSLHESPRCLSMITIEGSRNYPRRSCVSLNSSRCSSPTRLRTSGASSQPPTTPTSPKSSSSQKNSKFLNFFKLKKHINASKEALLLSSDNPTVSAGSRLSRTFWPFSRSNSAGESKNSRGVISPAPRRSNSAAESKTTSSSLLPNYAVANKRNSEAARSENMAATPMVFSRKPQTSQCLTQHTYKQGLPPHNSTSSHVKKNSSCSVPSNCGNDFVALSQMADGSRSLIVPTSSTSPSIAHTYAEVTNFRRAQTDEVDHLNSSEFSSICKELKANSVSPARHVRHASTSNPVRSMSRGSPAQQWSNPSMGSSTRSMQRFGPPVRSLNSRHKDALTRDTASIRVTPVLNVPACMTPSSKSKLFNLGNLFSKREKGARGYTMLVATGSQSGG